jgi:hypothetical protein
VDEDNWFEKAGREAEATKRAREAYARREAAAYDKRQAEKLEARRLAAQAAMTPPPRPREAAAAKELFEAVATGRVSMSTEVTTGGLGYAAAGRYHHPGPQYRPEAIQAQSRFPKPTPEQGLEAILKGIRETSDEDLLRVAGEWITKVTNGITEILRNREEN